MPNTTYSLTADQMGRLVDAGKQGYSLEIVQRQEQDGGIVIDLVKINWDRAEDDRTRVRLTSSGNVERVVDFEA